MNIEIKTASVKPIRNTYTYVARRFGDKPASRYQEATYDIQEEINFHYKPLWQPEHDVFDKRRTVIVMLDWYALKDPRQFYYGTYTTTRARQQEVMESNFMFVEKRGLLKQIPGEVLGTAMRLLIPMRHYEWGANMNNSFITAYGYGAAITNAAMFATMDRLGSAQYLTRIGLLSDGNQATSLDEAKASWMNDASWQPLRASMENMFVLEDWFELFVAQNLVFDGYLYPFVRHCIDNGGIANGAASLSMLTAFMSDWYDETAPWVNSVVKTVAAESSENRARLSDWIATWRDAARGALAPLARSALAGEAQSVLDQIDTAFDERLAKLGLAMAEVAP